MAQQQYDYQKLLAKYGYIEGGVGTDEDGDTVMVTIDKESAEVKTLQKNGWMRVHTYYPDGTITESFTK